MYIQRHNAWVMTCSHDNSNISGTQTQLYYISDSPYIPPHFHFA